jgi:hypothetical protein
MVSNSNLTDGIKTFFWQIVQTPDAERDCNNKAIRDFCQRF